MKSVLETPSSSLSLQETTISLPGSKLQFLKSLEARLTEKACTLASRLVVDGLLELCDDRDLLAMYMQDGYQERAKTGPDDGMVHDTGKETLRIQLPLAVIQQIVRLRDLAGESSEKFLERILVNRLGWLENDPHGILMYARDVGGILDQMEGELVKYRELFQEEREGTLL